MASENKKFTIGSFAYYVYMGDGFIPTIVQVKILRVCTDGNGYIASFSRQDAWMDNTTNKLVVSDKDEKELHTCDHTLFLSHKEAKEKARKMVNAEIQSLKEQQSVLSRSMNKFMMYKNVQPHYRKYEES